jgi:uncharacterized membrane protein
LPLAVDGPNRWKSSSMVVCDSCPDTKLRRVMVRPNRSLSWRQSMVFLGAIAVPLVLVSVVLALKGYWLILPFAGIELAGLFVCLYLVAHAACRCELISIGDSVVTVEKGRDRGRSAEGRGGPELRAEFARAWVRVEFTGSVRQRYPRRLWIGASGRRVEIGGFLADREKSELAAELDRLLSA